ncbi:MAG: POTRA domain-containing protein [bacterium]|nr:POTRA domain-containing protein [bacterium]
MKTKISFILLFFALLSFQVEAAEKIVHKIILHNQSPIADEIIRDVFIIKEGEPFNQERVEKGLEGLKAWGRFSLVQLKKNSDSKGVVLDLTLKGGLVISNINIFGNFPLLSRRVQATVLFRVGDLYDPQIISEQVERIRLLFEGEGYLGTTVSVREKIN